ncbi:MAG TPA: hypothetical protein VN721_17070 [Flavipsychrobacter sp.]|nr:hypothetical protein [Flavipsychrobacter sp.]
MKSSLLIGSLFLLLSFQACTKSENSTISPYKKSDSSISYFTYKCILDDSLYDQHVIRQVYDSSTHSFSTVIADSITDYKISKSLAVFIDTIAHYIVYESDTFSASPGSVNVYQRGGNPDYYSEITITSDSIFVSKYYSIWASGPDHASYLKGYKTP